MMSDKKENLKEYDEELLQTIREYEKYRSDEDVDIFDVYKTTLSEEAVEALPDELENGTVSAELFITGSIIGQINSLDKFGKLSDVKESLMDKISEDG